MNDWGQFTYNSQLICCSVISDNPTKFCQNEAVKGRLYCQQCIDAKAEVKKAEPEKAEES